ncbi:MAG: hypothetical protein KJ718_05720 [Nanoarchaeota archaeon]|nr:hypothetical protein [Nanoarchaeota archaeon]MBU1052021.1 hypothetical protein [Nanoarchaeota archaeon]
MGRDEYGNNGGEDPLERAYKEGLAACGEPADFDRQVEEAEMKIINAHIRLKEEVDLMRRRLAFMLN